MTEGDGKEKLEDFVNFCEDAIFEMQHASALMASDDEGSTSHARAAAFQIPTDEDEQCGLFISTITPLRSYKWVNIEHIFFKNNHQVLSKSLIGKLVG